MRFLLYITLFFCLASCWPSSVSFVDKGSMPEEWLTFSVKTLENNAANAPLSYPARLSEDIKDGVQNNTRLKLNSAPNSGEVQIEGTITNYMVSPIAIQEGDLAAKNRLTISVSFKIFTKAPQEDEMSLSATRFFDYDSNQDFTAVEQELITEINKQIVQDVINKLLSNW
ncbi:MAG: LPS assembly lipoprotein LptE [Bacteroidota bacterium]